MWKPMIAPLVAFVLLQFLLFYLFSDQTRLDRSPDITHLRDIDDNPDLYDQNDQEEPTSSSFIEVYMVPHSHCDAGWLKTFDEYHEEDVSHILSSIVTALKNHPHRKFGWVEVGFLERWWRDQSDQTKTQFRKLYEDKQIEFVAGGWVSNDEATVNYIQMINQMTLGHQFLQEQFGEKAVPRVGWQIDPFGLSQVTPALFSQMCFDSQASWRAKTFDSNYLAQYINDKSLEFVWRNSGSLLQTTDMLLHILKWSYSSPQDFLFEKSFESDITKETAIRIAKLLADNVRDRATFYRTNNLLWLWGDDFAFKKATLMFNSMDLVIDEINSNPEKYNCKVKYATPAEYFATLHKTQMSFPLKQRDFFPYQPTWFNAWVGYFTSRPTLKRYCRSTDALQRNADAIYSVTRLLSETPQSTASWRSRFAHIYELRKVQGIMQHHDAITGTMREHVNLDYIKLLDSAREGVISMLDDISAHLTGDLDMKVLVESVAPIMANNARQLTLFNSLPWDIQHYFEVETHSPLVQVVTRNNTVIESIVIINDNDTEKYVIIFMAQIPALGYQNYYLVRDQTRTFATQTEVYSNTNPSNLPEMKNIRGPAEKIDFKIENEMMKIEFNAIGNIKQVRYITEEGPQLLQLDYQHYRYKSNDTKGNHYTFLNEGPAIPLQPPSPLKYRLFKSSLMEEFTIQSSLSPSIITRVRLYRNQPFIELEETIEKIGKSIDIVGRFMTDINTEGSFFTDDSGFEIIRRQFLTNNTEPGNYYPGVYSSYIREVDKENPKQLTYLMDTPHGITSCASGCLEVMLHRSQEQILANGESLRDNNTAVLRSRLLLRTAEHSHRQHFATKFNFPPIAFISDEIPSADVFEKGLSELDTRSFLSSPFPDELFLLTFAHYDSLSNKVVVRVNNLLQSDGADYYGVKQLNDSTTPTITLNSFDNVRPRRRLESVEERTLSLNQKPEDCKRHHWHFEGENSHPDIFGGVVGKSNIGLRKTKNLRFMPLAIRSFMLNFDDNLVNKTTRWNEI